MSPNLLLIEDDPHLGPRLKRNLELSGYAVTLAQNGRTGLEMALLGIADLIILDLMLPLIDGLHILKKMRQKNIETPVIILTAKGTESEKIAGFQTGCDDYVSKPFSLIELIARVRAVLRRSGYRKEAGIISSAGLMIDPRARTARLLEKDIKLTPRAFDLLYALVSHPNQALSRNYLIGEVWGEDSEVTNRTVDSHIAILRSKLEFDSGEPQGIATVYKVGYKWCT